MSKSTKSAPSDVRINLIEEEKVFFNRKGDDVLVGQHAMDANNDYVFVLWQYSSSRDYLGGRSYAMDVDVFDEVSDIVKFIYVVDVDTKDLYKFTYGSYANAPTRRQNGAKQLVPAAYEAMEQWESCADHAILGFY